VSTLVTVARGSVLVALGCPKKCSKCGLEKNLSEFYARPGARDGLRRDCTECVSAKQRACSAKPEARAVPAALIGVRGFALKALHLSCATCGVAVTLTGMPRRNALRSGYGYCSRRCGEVGRVAKDAAARARGLE